MTERIIDAARYAHIRLIRVGAAVRERMDRVHRDESGQTSTEYLMIVGLMAMVILIAFVSFFWDTVKGAAHDWSEKVAKAIRGTNITE